MVVDSATVTGGEITLGDYAIIADIGRPYTCDLQMMPLTVQIDAAGFGRAKAINHAWVRVLESAGLELGITEDSLRPIKALQQPGGLITEETRSIVASDWTDDAQLLIRQSLPLPATVVSVTLEASIAE